MPTPLFELVDVAEISGEVFAEPEITQINRYITIASARMRAKVSGLDARIAAGKLDQDIVTGIGVDMVMRALATVRRGIGVKRTEYPEIMTEYSDGAEHGLIYLTDAELAELLDTPDEGGAFTIVPGGRP
ncbi:MAG: hypothetical protein JWN03_1184 [Nocardia sp.]|uniref:hypothetical protein n=1 Tax=Nocardia sp. TaxID=1821 RepID=UPI0026184FBB|nr:hypothetical protein [Nocardia sp.]MCU1640909.1 hypothetical protein [Nocardia sp.]